MLSTYDIPFVQHPVNTAGFKYFDLDGSFGEFGAAVLILAKWGSVDDNFETRFRKTGEFGLAFAGK